MAAKPDSCSDFQCPQLLAFEEFCRALNDEVNSQLVVFTEGPTHDNKMDQTRRLKPFLLRLMSQWEIFVRDLLQEAVEVVFTKLSSASCSDSSSKQRAHLQEIVAMSLLHQSSHTEASYSETPRKLLEQGAKEMSRNLLPDPNAWRSAFDAYKGYLLEKCRQVVPVFSGQNGINAICKELFACDALVSCTILKPDSLKYLYHCRDEQAFLTFSESTVKRLNTIMNLYYGVYRVLSDRDPNYFFSLDNDPLLNACVVSKAEFQEYFESDSAGDYLHYQHENIVKYGRNAYLLHHQYNSMYSFLLMLAPCLLKAVSTIIDERFGISF